MVRPHLGDERREQILEAFERCVIAKGLAKTTLKDVADEAGLGRPLVRYFVGNRSEMVDLLIDRMIERAEDGISKLRPKSRPITTEDLVVFLFDNTFRNDVSNNVVGELWYLAGRDDDMRARLARMYGSVIKMMTTQMQVDGLGATAAQRADAARTILSLVYGQASFREIGLPGMAGSFAKEKAIEIVAYLPVQTTSGKHPNAETEK